MSKEDTKKRARAIRRAPAGGEVVNRSCCGGGCHEDVDEAEEGPSEDDIRRFSDVTQECPECGTVLHDDVPVCWSCGHALAGAREGRVSPLVIVVIVLVVIALAGVLVLR